jgi:tRNA (cmo5U34)-methyltransferase
MSKAEVWKSGPVVANFLSGVRGAIPLAVEQIDVMLRLLRGSRPIQRFLDVGCGDGVLAAAILAEHPEAIAVCIDFSEPMLETARNRLPGSSHVMNVDYASPGWQDTLRSHVPFDAIVSGFSIHHQPDERKRGIYPECYSLLAPGGLFLQLEHVASATPWVESLHDDLFIDHLHAFDSSRPKEEVAAAYHSRPDKVANILAPVETQLQWMREIGYRDVDCYLKVFELAVFGGRRRS